MNPESDMPLKKKKPNIISVKRQTTHLLCDCHRDLHVIAVNSVQQFHRDHTCISIVVWGEGSVPSSPLTVFPTGKQPQGSLFASLGGMSACKPPGRFQDTKTDLDII